MSNTDPYDQLSYESIPFQDTHPSHLACLGRLFEMPTAEPDHCRVLELGCATGGNLIPMAWYLPRSHFLGVDLSANQIAEGQRTIAQLQLENVELRQGDILDLGRELGSFDYIIAHGVYSWVPAQVREKLLQLARQLLNPAGLLYLSFNTLPGWRMRGMLRDILGFACKGMEQVEDKLNAAYKALDRLDNALTELSATSARYLREEIKYLRGAHPSYLMFEYLAEENRAFLFSDFREHAQQQGLSYLCDTQLSFLFPSTFGKATEGALEDIGNDMELEQWLDFVSARNFRRCVLCRDDAAPAEELSLDAFAEFAFGSDLQPPPKIRLNGHKPAQFKQPDGNPVEVKHPLTKALLLEMNRRQPELLPLPTLLPGAEQQLKGAGGTEYIRDYDICLMELFNLFAHRALSATPKARRCNPHNLSAPAASRLARVQVASGSTHLATLRHTTLDLDSFAARLIHHLDGRQDLKQLSSTLLEELEGGILTPPDDLSFKNWSHEKLVNRFSHNCRELVGLFARQGVLESPGDHE